MRLLIFIFTLWFSINAYALKDCSSFFSSKNWHNCEGTVTHNDGGTSSGEWQNGKLHGQGTYTFPDGAKYVGEFKDDMYHGQGTLTLPDGTKYVGEWKDDMAHGQGTYTLPDGTKYVGEWKDDMYHGQGTLTLPDHPDPIRGYFINGEPITLICSDMGFSEGTKAFGDCVLKLIDKIN